MSFTVIRTNTFATMSRVMLERVSRRAAKGMLALSSGKRINSTEDDASGFAMARQLNARKLGMQQAMANISNAQNLLSIAAGSHQIIVNGLSRIRDLVLQGADDSYSDSQRVAIQRQINALIEEMDDIAVTTEFQDKTLLDGSFTGRSIQVGSQAGDTFELNIDDVRTAALGLIGLDVTDNAVASTSLDVVDAALQTLFQAMQTSGEILMRLDVKLGTGRTEIIALEATRSHIEDVEVGAARYSMIRDQFIRQIGFNALSQAIVAPQQVLSLIVS